MTRPVAFNAETARDIIRTVERMKRTPYARLERRQAKDEQQPWILVVTPPSGGIASGATSTGCTVQLVDETTGALTDDPNYIATLTVVNPYQNTVGNNVAFIVIGRTHTGVWIPISEDCT